MNCFQLQVLQNFSNTIQALSNDSLLCALLEQEDGYAAVANLSAASQSALSSTTIPWTPCSASSSHHLDDGSWAFLAKPGNVTDPDQLAATLFTVDTQPPDVEVSLADLPLLLKHTFSVQQNCQI